MKLSILFVIKDTGICYCLLQAPYSIDTILLTPIGAHKIANNLQNVGMCCEFPVQAIK